jgi:rubrerythrin
MNLKGSKTEINLMKAFAGESQARNRYTFFASKARKEGFVQIADIFEETANQEKEHAKRFFSFLQGGDVAITEAFPAGVIGSTKENLRASSGGEHSEWTEIYPAAARIAREEGFEPIAKLFESISIAEKRHEERFVALLKNLENDEVFKKSKDVTWRCRNCGFTHEGHDAPAACPACAHPQAYFEASLGLVSL